MYDRSLVCTLVVTVVSIKRESGSREEGVAGRPRRENVVSPFFSPFFFVLLSPSVYLAFNSEKVSLPL